MIKQAIIGFHQDEHDDWVADLACGHTQHVRHRPPWQLRPWVISIEGRARHLGQVLVCKKCRENIPSLCSNRAGRRNIEND